MILSTLTNALRTFADTMRTHVKGILTRDPDWEADLIGYQVESEWIVGDWDGVQRCVSNTEATTPSVLLAKILLAMRAGDNAAVSESLSQAKQIMGAPITAAGIQGYRRSYDAVLNLHMVHELELIHDITSNQRSQQLDNKALDALLRRLSARLNSTLPAFRIRESVLGMRRTAFGLQYVLPSCIFLLADYDVLVTAAVVLPGRP